LVKQLLARMDRGNYPPDGHISHHASRKRTCCSKTRHRKEREKKKAIEAGFVYIYIPFSLPKNIKIKIQQSTLVYRREQ